MNSCRAVLHPPRYGRYGSAGCGAYLAQRRPRSRRSRPWSSRSSGRACSIAAGSGPRTDGVGPFRLKNPPSVVPRSRPNQIFLPCGLRGPSQIMSLACASAGVRQFSAGAVGIPQMFAVALNLQVRGVAEHAVGDAVSGVARGNRRGGSLLDARYPTNPEIARYLGRAGALRPKPASPSRRRARDMRVFPVHAYASSNPYPASRLFA